MTSQNVTKLIDPALGLGLADWLDRVEDIALERGDFEPLGPDHTAILINGGRQLLVTFEKVDTIRGQVNQDVPHGWHLAEGHGWSQLCILGHGQTWFRNRAIYQYFDQLIDTGFFDNYDNVVFYGAESCGYAAAAYSVAAPGATVIAISPQATLDLRRTEWDNRFASARRLDFTDRYGFAPAMLDAAKRAFVFYDPNEAFDAMHAALFEAAHVSRIRCTHFDTQIELYLRQMDVLEGLILLAMHDRLNADAAAKALRQRRNYVPYLRRLLAAVEARDRPYLTGLMCRSVLTRINAPRFRRQLALAEQSLAAQGRALPRARFAAIA